MKIFSRTLKPYLQRQNRFARVLKRKILVSTNWWNILSAASWIGLHWILFIPRVLSILLKNSVSPIIVPLRIKISLRMRGFWKCLMEWNFWNRTWCFIVWRMGKEGESYRRLYLSFPVRNCRVSWSWIRRKVSGVLISNIWSLWRKLKNMWMPSNWKSWKLRLLPSTRPRRGRKQ